MTVKKLIEKLSSLSESEKELPVYYHDDGFDEEVEHIKPDKHDFLDLDIVRLI